jgi:hypothetical protein
MKIIRNAIISVVVIALLAFTAFFVLDAYNKGTIGNKAEKVADSFTEDIIGTWQGEYSISRITFKEEGKVSLTILGAALNGEYQDSYDLEKETHTLRVKYTTSFGVSVEAYYIAEIKDDQLSLIDTRLESVKMIYKRIGTEGASDTGTTASTSKVYNPGIKKANEDLLGKWNSNQSQSSGFEFKENSEVSLRLLGIGYDGTYSVEIDDVTKRVILKVDYISVGNVSVSNSYYLSIENDVMTLYQVGYENFSTTYTKAEF